mgnify:CR=1 FL=1
MAPQQQPSDPGATGATGSAPRARSRLRKLTTGLLVLAVLAAAGHLGWREYERREAPQPLADAPPPAAPAPALSPVAEDLHALREQLAGEIRERERLQAAVDALKNDLDRETAARRTAAPDTDTLAVMEVDHLLRLASLQIWAGRSPTSALALLERADALLAPLSDPAIAPVRAALIADTTALRLAATVDREGLYLRLGALQAAVATLDPAPRPVREPAPETAATQPPVGFWPRLLDNAATALRRFSSEHLRVRSLDGPPPALLSRAAETRLQQYLELLLSQAQLAMLEHEERIYRDALAHAARLLDAHFGLDPRTPALRTELTALQNEPVALALPDVIQSQERVRDYLTHEQQRRTAVTPP